MAVPDWLSRYFQQPTIRDGNGSDMPSRSNIKFVGPSVVDDVANDQTVITTTLGYAEHGTTGNWNVLETTGTVLISLTALAANATVKAPSNPQVGMKIRIAFDDASLISHNGIFDGNGKNARGPDASGATYTITVGQWGSGAVAGPVITFEYTGTEWRIV